MQAISPASPEERAKRSRLDRSLDHLRPGARAFEVVKRIAIGVYSDGFIHAGNLAYLALLTLFPFFICTAALAHALGRGADTMAAIDSVTRTLPRAVRDLLRQPIADVLAQRTGSLLWLAGWSGSGRREASSRRSATSCAAPTGCGARSPSGATG